MSSINLSNTCNKNQHWEKGDLAYDSQFLYLSEIEREGVRRTSNQEINSLSIIYDPIQKLTYPSRDRGKIKWLSTIKE